MSDDPPGDLPACGAAIRWWVFCYAHLGDIEVLGPKCESRGCMGTQAGFVHWPSGPVRCCAEHVAAWRRVADAMGVYLVVNPIEWTPVHLDDAEQRFRLLELC